ncbi:MAG: NAD(P)-binding domain-containing protein [Deltaproteobacteria bacterium]|nr:NAD(P)-binding domain-containing protein [Deltaproteobacteria bacterium]
MNMSHSNNTIDLAPLKLKKIGILGYGNQGRAQALNLRDSGFKIFIGLRSNSQSRKIAHKDGFQSYSFEEIATKADILMFLTPDETHSELFSVITASLSSRLSSPPLAQRALAGIQTTMAIYPILGFSHSYSFILGDLKLPNNLKYFLVAPKATGIAMRKAYLSGGGVPVVVSWSHKNLKPLTLAYAKALGCTKNKVFYANFKQEVISNLFSEQCLLPGGILELLKQGYETMVENGISPLMAFYESFYKLKFMVDILLEKGVAGMFEAISPIASYGALTRGQKVCDKKIKQRMKVILKDIKNGTFSKEWKKRESNLQKLKKSSFNKELEKLFLSSRNS